MLAWQAPKRLAEKGHRIPAETIADWRLAVL
jgi:hypothetical protein